MPERPSKKYYRDTARFYEPFASRSDESFFLKLAKTYGSPILELACGTGRVCLTLAQNGFDVTGIELSPEMLEIAQENLAKEPQDVRDRVTLLQGDITDFNLEERFAMIIVPTAFKFLLTIEDQLACLNLARIHLTDSGVFILDLYPGEITEPDGTGAYTTEVDGAMVTKTYTHTTDLVTQQRTWNVTVEIEHTNREPERIETKSITSIIMPRETELLVKTAGFEIAEDYSGNHFSKYMLGDWKRVLVLKKSRIKRYYSNSFT